MYWHIYIGYVCVGFKRTRLCTFKLCIHNMLVWKCGFRCVILSCPAFSSQTLLCICIISSAFESFLLHQISSPPSSNCKAQTQAMGSGRFAWFLTNCGTVGETLGTLTFPICKMELSSYLPPRTAGKMNASTVCQAAHVQGMQAVTVVLPAGHGTGCGTILESACRKKAKDGNQELVGAA